MFSVMSNFGQLRFLGLPLALAALLLAAAFLQYRWLGEISRADRERLHADLSHSTRSLATELEREVGRLRLAMAAGSLHRPPRGSEDARRRRPGPLTVAKGISSWQQRSRWPEMLKGVYLLETGRDGSRLAKFTDDETPRLEPIEPANAPPAIKKALAKLRESGRGRQAHEIFNRQPVLEGPIVIGPPVPVGRTGRRRGFPIALLDRNVMASEVIPQLVAQHFGDGETRRYDLVVATATGEELFALGQVDDPDASVDLLTVRRGAGLGAGERPGGRHGRLADRDAEIPLRGEHGIWTLVAQHRAGSLDAVVDRARQRNAAIGLLILGLMGATSLLLVRSERRARHMAQQQAELVAGITHELHTPLAAIRAAGQNLADGVVQEPERVSSYGELIMREGQRLSTLVSQSLDFAGIVGERRTLNLEELELEPLLTAAAESVTWLAEERGSRVRVEASDDLPPLRADHDALRRALTNLLVNALKYGPDSQRVTLRARSDGAHRVYLEVEDQGPGIPAGERGAAFEPFARGKGAQHNTVPGSGLGLAIVERTVLDHGGTVAIHDGRTGDSENPGCVVSIRLPAELPMEDG